MNLCTTLFIAAALVLASAAVAQEMPAPTFSVGDRWTFRETDLLTKNETGRWTETVTAEGGQRVGVHRSGHLPQWVARALRPQVQGRSHRGPGDARRPIRKTLRLEAKGFATNETNNNVMNHERVIWLVPAAKREVRHEIRTQLRSGVLFRVEGRELMAFKPGP